jgi:RNA polymerase sigma-70 factor (sigma-E family)
VTDADGPFTEYVAERATTLLRFATLITGDRGAGEDLLQTTLEGVYGRWIRRGPPTDLDAYVHTALVNGARRRWRRQSRLTEHLVDQPPEQPSDPPLSDVVVRQQLLAALRRLPSRQRVVLALRYFEDRSEAEVARMLGCSVGSIKAHTNRGITRLRTDAVLSRYIDLGLEV